MAQAALPLFALSAERALPAAHAARHAAVPAAADAGCADATGFEIGWDHAHHRLTPPLAHLQAESPVRQGWSAGRAVFGARTLKATAAVRQWLALRLEAWQSGQAFEAVQVSPHFLAQIDATHCPVQRSPLLLATGRGDDAVVQRLNADAAYAAGNLAVTSRAVAEARAGLDFAALLAQAQRLAAGECASVRNLGAAEWLRLAVLASFATPLPHARAACLPLVVLPPNRVRVLNPVQALQVMLTLQFTQPGWARRLPGLALLMPGSEARQAFQVFMHTLLARRMAAGADADAPTTRRTLEDAWGDVLVQRRWQRLALWLTPASCEQLLQRASARGWVVGGGRWLSGQAATEGWALAGAEAEQAAEAGAAAPQAPAAAGSALRPGSARKRGSQKLAS